jgi:hypothetical protein
MKNPTGAFVGVTLAALLAFCARIVYETVSDKEPPISFEYTSIKGYPHGSDTVIVFARKLTAKYKVNYILERYISCKFAGGEYVFDLPQFRRQYESGTIDISNRVIVFPVRIPAGTECSLDTDMWWIPDFSMSYHVKHYPTERFVIGAEDE